jgi:hypothetical protein
MAKTTTGWAARGWCCGGIAASLARMPSSRSYAEQVASNLLNRYGLAAIWQLHLSAASAYRKGNAMAARSIIDVAEAAEREWLRRAAADLKQS